MRCVEICDLTWTPTFIRDAVTDLLGAYHHMFGVYKDAAGILDRLILSSGRQRVFDLCSGRGAHLLMLNRNRIEVIASDLRPNNSAFRCLALLGIRPMFQPFDATAPIGVDGVRTMFSALHHFDEHDVRSIIKCAALERQPFAFFEFTEPSVKGVIGVLFGQVFAVAITPFIKPITLPRLFFTYVIPVIPFVLFWDGVVSCLRTYSTNDLARMTSNIDGMKFSIGKLKYRNFLRPNITFICGEPA